ncbi:MAG: hypothetical protein ACI9G1_002754 [Pirellulaceae bacterium]
MSRLSQHISRCAMIVCLLAIPASHALSQVKIDRASKSRRCGCDKRTSCACDSRGGAGTQQLQTGPTPTAPTPPTDPAAPYELPNVGDDVLNAPLIDDLNSFTDLSGVTRGSRGSIPNVIGDFFGGGSMILDMNAIVTHRFHTTARISSGSPGAQDAKLIFGDSANPSFQSLDTGSDATSDGFADTFSISEPLAPNAFPVSPGSGLTFAGGTAVFVGNVGGGPTGEPGSPPAGALAETAQDGVFFDDSNWFTEYSFSGRVDVVLPTGMGAATRRVKMAENNSPIPRNRLIFGHNFFNDVTGFGDVRRYTMGFETTNASETASIDVRFPFASTIDSDYTVGGLNGANTEFGNISIAGKMILHRDASFLLTGGVGFNVPTADDLYVRLEDGTTLLHAQNDSLHVLPFFGALWTGHDRFFVQGFLQVDIDTNGNDIYAYDGTDLVHAGRLQDSTLIYGDIAVGYFLYQDDRSRITSIVPVAELHYASSLQDADELTTSNVNIFSDAKRLDTLNLTLGTHISFGNNIVVTPGMTIPLRREGDRVFDYEAAIQANIYY